MCFLQTLKEAQDAIAFVITYLRETRKRRETFVIKTDVLLLLFNIIPAFVVIAGYNNKSIQRILNNSSVPCVLQSIYPARVRGLGLFSDPLSKK